MSAPPTRGASELRQRPGGRGALCLEALLQLAALEPARDIADRLVVRGVECEYTTEEQHQLLVEQGQLVVRPRASHRVLLRAAGLKRAPRRDLGQPVRPHPRVVMLKSCNRALISLACRIVGCSRSLRTSIFAVRWDDRKATGECFGCRCAPGSVASRRS